MGFRDNQRFRKIYSYYRPRPKIDDTIDVADTFNGWDWKQSVRLATTGNISITGTFLAKTGIDSGAGAGNLNDEDRILVKSQTNKAENGIYIWYSTDGKLVRALDATQDALTSGATCYVEEGTYEEQVWTLITKDPITVGTTLQDWSQIMSGGGGGSGNEYWFSTIEDAIYTTGSVLVRGGLASSAAEQLGGDIFFYVSGSISGSGLFDKKAVFGGDVRASGSFAQGYNVFASGTYSHAEGSGSVAVGRASHAEGIKAETNLIGYHPYYPNVTTYGEGAHAEGEGTVASGRASHAEGYLSAVAETAAHAHVEGYNTYAAGYSSHTEGGSTYAVGDYSHAEGWATETHGSGSHAEGLETLASGSYSHAEGFLSIASGTYSHAEGSGSIAIGSGSHAEGIPSTSSTYNVNLGRLELYGYSPFTVAASEGSHAEGGGTVTTGLVAHSEGLRTIASGDASHAEGSEVVYNKAANPETYYKKSTVAKGYASHAEGGGTLASGSYSHSEGYSTFAGGRSSHTEGEFTTAVSRNSHAEGENTSAGLKYYTTDTNGMTNGIIKLDSSFGDITQFINDWYVGNTVHLLNTNNFNGPVFFEEDISVVDVSFDGTNTYITSSLSSNVSYTFDVGLPFNDLAGFYDAWAEPPGPPYEKYVAHSEGYETYAFGNYSHSEGNGTIALGNSSHAEGIGSIAIGSFSHAEGVGSLSLGVSSHTEGAYTVASGNYQHVAGKFNTLGNDFSLLVIGDGSDAGNRSDILRVNSGSAPGLGQVQVTGSLVATLGLSGSLTTLADGTSYLIAGTNITITSASNGAVTISSTGGGIGDSYFISTTNDSIYTTGSAAFRGSESIDSPLDKGSDVFFYVSGAIEGDKKALFGGDLVVSGSSYHMAAATFDPLKRSVYDIGSDVYFFVSGSSGSLGTNTRGVAAFGGDVAITGTLKVGTGSVLITSNDVQFGDSSIKIEKSSTDLKFYDGAIPAGVTLSSLVAGASIPSYWTSPNNNLISTTGSVRVQGDLIVNGTTTTINTTNLEVKDAVIGLGFSSGTIAQTADDRGFIAGLSGGDNAAFLWKNASSEFVVGRTTISPSGSVPIALTSFANFRAANIKADIVTASLGFSGSLTKLVDGTSFIIAGNNLSVTSASNGAITIGTTIPQGGIVTASYFDSTTAGSIFTTGSAAFRGTENISSPVQKGGDVFFYVSGSLDGSNKSLFGGDVRVSGSINTTLLTASNANITSLVNTIATSSYFTVTNEFVLATNILEVTGNLYVTNTLSSSIITGTYIQSQDIRANTLTGSLTKLFDGTNYLIAGAGIQITTGSNGAVTITNDGTVGDITAVNAGTGLTGGGSSGAVTLNINDSVVATVSGTTFTGVTKHNSGLSGSLTKLTDGTSYLIAGNNLSITTGTNGAVTIGTTVPEGSIVTTSYFDSTVAGSIFTTGSTAFRGNSTIVSPSEIGSDVFFYVSGTMSNGNAAASNKKAVFGGDVRISGSLTIDPLGDATRPTSFGSASFSQGSSNRAEGNYSHAEGVSTIALGLGSHAEGSANNANAAYSHAEGIVTFAGAPYTHTEGYGAVAYSQFSHAEGQSTRVFEGSEHAHVEGYTTRAHSVGAHAEGTGSIAAGRYAHAEGSDTSAGAQTFRVPNGTMGGADAVFILDGIYGAINTSFVTGNILAVINPQDGYVENVLLISRSYDAMLGQTALTASYYSRSVSGVPLNVFPRYSTDGILAASQMYKFTQFGNSSHAEGIDTISLGEGSHSEGIYTTAFGTGSHAEGHRALAYGTGSHAEGSSSIAIGSYSHSEGLGTIASGSYQHVGGKYNKRGNDFSLFVIGDGTSDFDTDRNDVFRVNNGRAEVTGSFVATLGLSGSLTRLADGATPYLVAGPNITINTSSVGSVEISSSVSISIPGANNNVLTSDGSGAVVAESNLNFDGSLMSVTGSIEPGADIAYNLGSPEKRWANVYTGDLHLRNDRGDWTLIEEEDCLTVRNNVTGKRYKISMTPYD